MKFEFIIFFLKIISNFCIEIQVHPFEEAHLHDLPPNLILSQEWRIGARPILSIPKPKKPITYQSAISSSTSQSTIPLTQISQQQDKRISNQTENNGYEISTNGANSHGIASIVNAFNQSSGGFEANGNRSSRSSSVASTQPVVPNLIKIYSEAIPSKSQRHDSTTSAGKHDELTKIYEQATNRNQQRRTSSPSNDKQQPQVYEEAIEEITWDNLVHGYIL